MVRKCLMFCDKCDERFTYNPNRTMFPKCPHCKRKKIKYDEMRLEVRMDGFE